MTLTDAVFSDEWHRFRVTLKHQTESSLHSDSESESILVGMFKRNRIVLVLLAATMIVGCGGSEPSVEPPIEARNSTPILFRNVANDWSIDFVDAPARAEEYPFPAITGSGCGIVDFDNNGHLDIVFVALESARGNVAFYSQTERGKFIECSADVGLKDAAGTGIAVADCNNDGWPDIYIASTNRDTLWLNQEGRAFQDATVASGISNPEWGTSACWLDFDRDGWLDLFVTNYIKYEDRTCTRLGGGDADFCSPALFDRTADVLFRNITGESTDGKVAFSNVSRDSGISGGLSAGLGVTAADLNGDNWVDIYVASDQHPNLLWVNRQGVFTDEATVTGCDLDFQGRPQSSMGIALGDINNDGVNEIVVSHLDAESHAVYSPVDRSFYRDICRQTGLSALTRSSTGFGVTITDFNLDGTNEVLTVNGRVKRDGDRGASGAEFWQPYRQPIQLLLRNTKAAESWRVQRVMNDRPFLARGLAVGDLDRDGLPDALVSTIGEPALVLRNESTPVNSGITIRFVDPELSGRSCPGATYTLIAGKRTAMSTFQPCQSYMSSHADEVYLSIPSDTADFTLEVIWPHGSMTPERFRLTPSADSPLLIERGRGVELE